MLSRTKSSWEVGLIGPRVVALIAVAWLLMWLAGCVPDLPGGTTISTAGMGDAALSIEPAAPLDAALPVLRLRLALSGATSEEVDLSQVVLVEGRVGPAHLRQIAQGKMSNALLERVVPVISWVEATETGAVAVVAPTVVLMAGETYALAVGTLDAAFELQIATEGAPPVLPRLWPPVSGSATTALGVWCGDAAHFEAETPAELLPEGPRGALRRGAVDTVGAGCVRFEADGSELTTLDSAASGPFVGPPAVGDGPVASLDPRPFVADVEAPPPPEAAVCDPGEVPFGLGCAAIADDRIFVRSGGVPLLWAVHGEGIDAVVATAPGDPFLVAPLPPLSPIVLSVSTIDVAGRTERRTVSQTTLAPMPHVVITEVLSNPLGPEPEQEWVEVYNDGTVTADLGGYTLCDIGGETLLPPAPLAPSGYALLVNDDFIEDDELDPPPAPGTLILRVAKLGKDGLANAGEPLKLKDAAGAIVSRTPASPKPKAGMSLARVSVRAPDGLPTSFAANWPTPGRENILGEETP